MQTLADTFRGPIPCIDKSCAGVKTAAGLAGSTACGAFPHHRLLLFVGGLPKAGSFRGFEGA